MSLEPFLSKVHCSDCVDLMAKLPDGSIDLVVTSPPYDSVRAYCGFSFDVSAVASGLWRVMAEGGVVVWVVADQTKDGSETGTSFKHALTFKDTGFKLYDTMIYRKANPIPKNHRRYEQAWEFMFVFSKGKPRVFNPLMDPCKCAGKINRGTMRNEGKDELSIKHGHGKPVKATKIRSNVWTYSVGAAATATDSLWSAHPAVFPLQLARDHIASWSGTGDVVFDPFAGSGQTLIAAKEAGRRWLGSDLAEDYVALSETRLASV